MYEKLKKKFLLKDNCRQKMKLELTVLSNEFSSSNSGGNMVLIKRRNEARHSNALQVFVEPKV